MLRMDEETKVLITGANGFLGRFVKKQFLSKTDPTILTPSKEELNLLDINSVEMYLDAYQPNVIIHLAGMVGGIGLNKAKPGTLTYQNLKMGMNLIEVSRVVLKDLKKFVCIGTTCSYAENCPIPFKEMDFLYFNMNGPGMPEPTNAGYGLSKRMLYELLRNYHQQYKFPFIYLIPVNLYGPGDHFEDDKSHVIPALIKKFHSAKDEVTLWGDGSPTREFLYVEDAANAILRATICYDEIYPLNIGNGVEIKISDLAQKIATLTGFKGEIKWDSNQPNGQMRRCMDISRMQIYLGDDICNTSIDLGLDITYQWVLNNQEVLWN